MNELVSIIMPAYNDEKYIKESILSVLNQTYTEWELIIVEDCSTDNTCKIIRTFDDERIRLLKNDNNMGAALSRNRALREAKGRWIAFLDADDIWAPEKLQRQIAYMKENELAFTYTDYKIKLNGQWLPYVYIAPDFVNRRRMYNYCYFSTITVIYDANVVGLIQIKDLKKNNDYAMWLHAVERTTCYRFPYCLAYYIKHDNSVSSGRKIGLIKWHYLLFRVEMEKSVVASVILTVNNIVHGIIKKIVYKKRVKK